MRGPLLGLLALALIASPLGCEEKKIVKVVEPEAPPEETPEEEEAPPEETPKPTDPLVVDLGTVDSGVDVPFEIPAGALGFNIIMEGQAVDFDPQAPFGIERITDPTGKVVHQAYGPVGGTKSTSTASFDVIAAASVPQSEVVPTKIPAGKWKVRFGVQGDPTAKPKVRAKVRVQATPDGVFHGGTLDLHIHVPQTVTIGSAEIDHTDACSDPRIKERVETFFALTKQLLGITKGTVKCSGASSGLAELDDNEIIDGFAISGGEKEGTPVLHVLITNAIRIEGQPVAQGISPGIPGAANLFGRGVSGIIVSPTGFVDEDVLVMLHEAGHFIGLNHTTEFDGQSSDPLSDTPVCDDISHSNLGACPDRSNVMFAAGAISGPVNLSPTQKRVYRGSPIYKAFATGTPQTQSLPLVPAVPFQAKRHFRISGGPLSPAERELSTGFCGLNPIDHDGLAQRYGIEQLKAAAKDADLAPYIRGRANVALKRLGVTP